MQIYILICKVCNGIATNMQRVCTYPLSKYAYCMYGMSKIINQEQTNWKTIYCVGCGDRISHDVTLDEMEEREFKGFESVMCLVCYETYTARRVAQLIDSIAS